MTLPLPIDELIPRLLAALDSTNCVVLHAPPGAGKTTRVPPALWRASPTSPRQIIVLQPRRLAARSAAARIAAEQGVTLGQEVGYRVRFDSQAGPRTRIVAMTDGIFLRQLQDDPLLENVDAVIFDEFHERNLNLDLALAMVRRAQLEVRPELKIVVMSATLSAAPVAWYLGGCPVLESPARTHPVEIRYLRHVRSEPVPIAAAQAVRGLVDETAGHVLVFLPGVGEIRRMQRELESFSHEHDLAIMPLHGELPLDEQQAVLEPSARRKVVLATNVAETSITIEGVTAVIDSGQARRLDFDPACGLNRFLTFRISKAAADQRAGRAGRTAPGVCLRLWTEREQQGLAEYETPEVVRVDLSGAVLELMAWGESDVDRFPWYEAPPAEALDHARRLLAQLGAIAERGMTPVGQRMARLPVHPRIARLLCEGQSLGHPRPAALAAALLAERDPFRSAGRGPVQAAQHWSASDVADRVALLEEFERPAGKHRSEGSLHRDAARFVLRARDQLLRLVQEHSSPTASPATSEEALARAVWTAFADRLARRREPGSRRAVMLGGRGIVLSEQSAVTQAELFVCVELHDAGKAEMVVHQASAVERDWLPPVKLKVSIDLEFDSARGRVVAVRRTRFEDLVLDEAPTSVPSDDRAAELLAREAAARLERSQWLSEAAQSFAVRVNFLRQWIPELELPALDDEQLDGLLPQICQGCTSFDQLPRAPVLDVLRRQFTPQQLWAIDRDAPERLQVPSGSQIALVYEPGRPPVLAVRIQELFGLHQTPRVAGGRVAVLLHLLAPNMRPQQVTDDLAGFWERTYPTVRKELKRRYPKHAWPDDPRHASAEYMPGRKR